MRRSDPKCCRVSDVADDSRITGYVLLVMGLAAAAIFVSARMVNTSTLKVWLCRLCLVVSFYAVSAAGGPEDEARKRATLSIGAVEKAERRLTAQGVPNGRKTPEKLVAEAELHLRTGNHAAAIDKLSRVVELRRQGRASESTDADAQFMLGKAYFATGQLYSARRHFENVTNRAEEPAFAGMGGPSASRLVDIALSIQRKDSLADVLGRVERMLKKSSDPSLLYARSKALFAMDRFDDSLVATGAIAGDPLYVQRGAYLRGTTLMRLAQVGVKERQRPDYSAAIESFFEATKAVKERGQAAVDSQQIADLSWLAIARLNYAVGRNGSAADAYQKVERSSKLFSQALFELAWTYVRLGDYERGERALEALSVLDPGLIDGADGELLRGDLLLRSGRFKEADSAYLEIRKKYEPLRQQVSAYVQKHTDPAVYYDKLTAAEIELGHELPTVAVEWAREEAKEERIFAIVDDVARSRKLIRRSRRIIDLLRASLASGSQVKLFSELSAELQETLIQQNILGTAHLALARGMDHVATNMGPRVEAIRTQRRELAERLSALPTTAGNISVREAQSQQAWQKVSQQLQRLQLQADHLSALVNGLRRVVREAETHGVVVNTVELSRYRLELAENEKDLALYFSRIKKFRRQVELGLVQIGFGDAAFAEDDRIRAAYTALVREEAKLAQASSNKREAAFAVSITVLLRRAEATGARLAARRLKLQREVKVQAKETRAIVEAEALAVESHAARLDTMDQHARLLVGEVAKRNFLKVRDRLSNVVMRTDIGLAQQAWEVREEQRERVRDLLRQRAREERIINEELSEVLDDGNGGRL